MVKFNQTVPEQRAEVLDKALDKMIDGVEETMAVKATGPTWRGNEIGPAGLVEDNHFNPSELAYTPTKELLRNPLTRGTVRRCVQHVIIQLRGIDAKLESAMPMEPDDLVRAFGMTRTEAEQASLRHGCAAKAALVEVRDRIRDSAAAFGQMGMDERETENDRKAASAASGCLTRFARMIDEALNH